MKCARCGEPIRPDEAYRKVDHHAASGPGVTLHVHERRCKPLPQQTYPARRFGV